MRLFLATALILLFLWLHLTQTPNDLASGCPCGASPASQAAASLLLSPLSLYCWSTSTLARLLLSAPALVLSSLHHTLLLLLAAPWCALEFCLSLASACLRVALFLLHLALAVAVAAAAASTLERSKTAAGGEGERKATEMGRVSKTGHGEWFE